MRGVLVGIPDGDAGTYATLRVMADMARRSSILPIVRQAAVSAVRGLPGNDGTGHARLIRDWVSDRTYFLNDPLYAEALHVPGWSLAQILTRGNVGLDCDDVATLAAAMGLSVGLRARFVIAGFSSPQAPYRHVWTELSGASGPPRWVAVDPTRPVQSFASAPIRRLDCLEV